MSLKNRFVITVIIVILITISLYGLYRTAARDNVEVVNWGDNQISKVQQKNIDKSIENNKNMTMINGSSDDSKFSPELQLNTEIPDLDGIVTKVSRNEITIDNTASKVFSVNEDTLVLVKYASKGNNKMNYKEGKMSDIEANDHIKVWNRKSSSKGMQWSNTKFDKIVYIVK